MPYLKSLIDLIVMFAVFLGINFLLKEPSIMPRAEQFAIAMGMLALIRIHRLEDKK